MDARVHHPPVAPDRSAVSETKASGTARGRGARERLFGLMVKETRQALRDPSSILIAFVLPLVLLFLFAYAISLDLDRVRIGLVTEEASAASTELSFAFRATRYFDVTPAKDRRAVEADVVSSELRGFVVIPQGFGEAVASGRPADVQVVTDGAEPNTAQFVANYARGTVAAWEAGRQAEGEAVPPQIEVQSRFWFNEELTSQHYLVPGSIAIVMTLIGTLLTALVVAREWERGTMEAIMATPVTVPELIAGKVVPYFVLGLGAMTMCTLISVFVIGVPFRGSVLALLLVSAVFLIPSLGQGLLISAATKNQFVASQLALITGFLPAFLLSGFIFEIGSMPSWIQAITVVVPARYLVPSIQTVFLSGDVWPLIWPRLGAMAAIGVVFFALAARETEKRVG